MISYWIGAIAFGLAGAAWIKLLFFMPLEPMDDEPPRLPGDW